MSELLLELFSEEIPARMQKRASEDLVRIVCDALKEAGVEGKNARAYATPRRLALVIDGLPERTPDVKEERKGPKVGAPQQAIDGFLRAAGLASIDQATVQEDKKGAFYVAVTEKKGRATADLIAEIVPAVIRAFPWPKSMRWGAASARPGSLRWVRPLQSIVCTFGPETSDPVVVDFEVDGIRAGNVTFGHRFHAPEAITVRRFDDYVARLEAAKVVLDAERRKRIILDDARNLAFAAGLDLVEDEGLLEEVSGLVEWPVVLMGEFEDAFLDIPAEVIRLTIRANQKCFVTRPRGEAERLSNRFVLVANVEASDGGVEIARGNGKVVRARLSDAVHFWKTDQADLPDLSSLDESAQKFALDLKKPLDQRMARLDRLGVTFHAKLGTQGERVERIRKLATALAPLVGAEPALAGRAAVLAKADLQTEVVGEFPELQGAMGRKYALLQGEDASVAAAIEEHYRPQGPSDTVPADPISIAVALADKLDTLVGFWAIDEKPTGSKDPYALRRAALGVIRILVENGIRLRLLDATGGDRDLLSFFHDRLKVYLRDKGARHDLIDAVISPEADDLLLVVSRVAALGIFLDTEDGRNLLAGTKRAANILAAEEKKGTAIAGTVDPALFRQDEERALLEAVTHAEHEAADAIARQDFSAAMQALAAFRRPVDAFFEAVLVNDEDAAVRANRLALLSRIRGATGQMADFSKIAG